MHLAESKFKNDRNASRLNRIVQKFNTMDITEIMSCFSDDVITRYNGAPIIKGKTDLCEFLSHRYADITEYSLTKLLRFSEADKLAVEAYAIYKKKSTDEYVVVSILEFLEFDGDLIRKWDYVGHVAQQADPLEVASALVNASSGVTLDRYTFGAQAHE